MQFILFIYFNFLTQFILKAIKKEKNRKQQEYIMQ